MSNVAQIGKLEDLLGRITRNRRAVSGVAAVAHAAPAPIAAAPTPTAAAPMAAVPLPPMELTEPTTEERLRPPKPTTPMEMALETELESRPEAEMDVEITIDEGPELSIDEEGELIEAAPTAPVGLRAPAPEPEVLEPEVPEPAATEPLLPRPIEVAAARPSTPIARVVSRPERRDPATFGELLGRTLALRPR